MIDTVYFHIGSPKTGTSVIQSHMSQNRTVLRYKGVLYPITVSTDRKLYRNFESHHLLTYSWAEWQPFSRFEPQAFFSRAEATATRFGLKTMLLSAENTFWLPMNIVKGPTPSEDEYWGRKRKYVETIFNDLGRYRTKILVYLRRQDRWLESWYNQQVKNGNRLTGDVEEFAVSQRYLLDYESQLKLWADAFGADNVEVRVYEKEQLPDGLLKDYLEMTGLGGVEEFPLRKKPRFNAQLGRDALEFMNLCNALDLDGKQAYRLRGIVRKITNQLDSELVFHRQSLLTPAQRAALIEEYSGKNDRIARAYLKRPDGRLFREAPTDIDEPWAPYEGLSTETIVKLLVSFMMELHTDDAVVSGRNRGLFLVKEKLLEVMRDYFPGVASSYLAYADKVFWRRNIWKAN